MAHSSDGEEATGAICTGIDIGTVTGLGFKERLCGGDTPEVTDDTGVAVQTGRCAISGGGKSKPTLDGIEPSRGAVASAAVLLVNEPVIGDRACA